jgi:hypothetical protein
MIFAALYRKIEYIIGKLQFSAQNMTALVQNQTTKMFGPFSALF